MPQFDHFWVRRLFVFEYLLLCIPIVSRESWKLFEITALDGILENSNSQRWMTWANIYRMKWNKSWRKACQWWNKCKTIALVNFFIETQGAPYWLFWALGKATKFDKLTSKLLRISKDGIKTIFPFLMNAPRFDIFRRVLMTPFCLSCYFLLFSFSFFYYYFLVFCKQRILKNRKKK